MAIKNVHKTYEYTKENVRNRLNAWMYVANGDSMNLRKEKCIEMVKKEVSRIKKETHTDYCPFSAISPDIIEICIGNMIYPEYIKSHFCTPVTKKESSKNEEK